MTVSASDQHRTRVALTAGDLQDEGGRALRDEYAVAEENGEFIVHIGEAEADRLGLGDLYRRRRDEQGAVTEDRRRRVLIVDDEEPIRRLVSQLIARRGLTPDTAVDGDHALEKLRRGDYAVVLLDLLMPKRDGFEVLKAMRAERMFLPVIVISSAAEPLTRELDPYLVVAVIHKPFEIALVAEVAAALADACSQ